MYGRMGQMKKEVRKNLLKIAEEQGTPLYVYDLSKIRTQYNNLIHGITYRPLSIHYAVKANWNLEILRTLKEAGSKLECVSIGEVEQGLRAGFVPENIRYTCSSIDREELRAVAEKGVCINLDSLNQLTWFGEEGLGEKVSLRINHDVGEGGHSYLVTGGHASKFGIHWTHLDQARVIAEQYGLKITGLHQHVGSHILEEHLFIGSMNILLETALGFPDLESVDFGGGFGVPYHPEDRELDMQKLGSLISETFSEFTQKYGRSLELVFEPGRYIVAESGYLLVKVTDVKKQPAKTFVGINSGMNHLIRPCLYDAFHNIENLSSNNEKEKVTVVGNICESSDIFGEDREIAHPEVGDVLVIHTVGAYGFAMASEYDMRKRPNEIVVDSLQA